MGHQLALTNLFAIVNKFIEVRVFPFRRLFMSISKQLTQSVFVKAWLRDNKRNE